MTIFLLFLVLTPVFMSTLEDWMGSFGVVLGNIDGDFHAIRDLYRKDLIYSIPLNSTLHPLEDYPFKEFFNISSKDTLIGRLIIERLLGNESSLFPWLETLKKPEEMTDLFHFSDRELEDFLSRSFEEPVSLKSRKEKYLKIRKNIPVSLLTEQSLNFEIYNWAASIVDATACVYEMDQYDPGKLGLIKFHNPSGLTPNNLLLIPLLERIQIIGLDTAKPGIFNEDFDEHLYLRAITHKTDRLEVRAQKLIEKGKPVVIADSKSNREYLQYNGFLAKEETTKDFLLKIKPEFDMERVRLCWELNVSQRKSLLFSFNLNSKSLNINLALYSRIALLQERDNYEDDKHEILRRLEEDGVQKQKLDVFLVYWKVLMLKWKEFIPNRTSLKDDLRERFRKNLGEKRSLGLEFAINGKEVFLRNVEMVQRKVLKEVKKQHLALNAKF